MLLGRRNMLPLGLGRPFSIANDEQGYPLAQEGLRDFDMARHSDTGVTGERIAEYGSRLSRSPVVSDLLTIKGSRRKSGRPKKSRLPQT